MHETKRVRVTGLNQATLKMGEEKNLIIYHDKTFFKVADYVNALSV